MIFFGFFMHCQMKQILSKMWQKIYFSLEYSSNTNPGWTTLIYIFLSSSQKFYNSSRGLNLLHVKIISDFKKLIILHMKGKYLFFRISLQNCGFKLNVIWIYDVFSKISEKIMDKIILIVLKCIVESGKYLRDSEFSIQPLLIFHVVSDNFHGFCEKLSF